jgi:hypothetical protein
MDVDYQVITSKKKYFLLLPDNSDFEYVNLGIIALRLLKQGILWGQASDFFNYFCS